MQEIINCPSCQRRLQVPEALIGQDVQCPTCSATFVAAVSGSAPPPGERLPEETEPELNLVDEASPERPARRRRREDDYEEYDDDDRYRRRRRRDLAPHRGSTVLTLGILSLVICWPILGPIAWAMGSTDLTEMRQGRMDPEGEGITNAGRICGMIASIFGIIGVILFCIYVFAFISLAGRRF
jgi:hypothetical protein